MNSKKNYSLEDLKLNDFKDDLSNLKPIFYSFGTSIFILMERLKPYQRLFTQSLFERCMSFVDNNPDLRNYIHIQSNFSYSNSLVSNLIYLSNFPNIKDVESIEYGICASIIALQHNKKRELNSIKKSLFYDKELKNFSNKKILRIYKKTFKDFNKSLHLIENADKYSIEFDKNEKLVLKRNDIIQEFKRRSKMSRFCQVFDDNDKSQGYVYFIPKFSEDDNFIVFYKHIPYTMYEFKKKNLHVKRKDGKISWK